RSLDARPAVPRRLRHEPEPLSHHAAARPGAPVDAAGHVAGRGLDRSRLRRPEPHVTALQGHLRHYPRSMGFCYPTTRQELTGGPAMTSTTTGLPEGRGYHAHVYYDAASRPVAERLRGQLVAGFPVELGRFSDDPVGPHPVSQFQVIFKTDAFQSVVPWLMLRREGLDILVHPLTDDMVD